MSRAGGGDKLALWHGGGRASARAQSCRRADNVRHSFSMCVRFIRSTWQTPRSTNGAATPGTYQVYGSTKMRAGSSPAHLAAPISCRPQWGPHQQQVRYGTIGSAPASLWGLRNHFITPMLVATKITHWNSYLARWPAGHQSAKPLGMLVVVVAVVVRNMQNRCHQHRTE